MPDDVVFYWAVVDAHDRLAGLFPTYMAARWYADKGVLPPDSGSVRIQMAAVHGRVILSLDPEFRRG